MKNITPVVVAIIHKDSRFLLTERKEYDPEVSPTGRVWHFPGGEVEFGEEPEIALRREIKEELSVELDSSEQLPRIFTAVRKYWHGILIPFICTAIDTENIIINDESHQYKWFTYEEVKSLHKLPFVQEMLDDAVVLLKKG